MSSSPTLPAHRNPLFEQFPDYRGVLEVHWRRQVATITELSYSALGPSPDQPDDDSVVEPDNEEPEQQPQVFQPPQPQPQQPENPQGPMTPQQRMQLMQQQRLQQMQQMQQQYQQQQQQQPQ